jgi:hypothetical protein
MKSRSKMALRFHCKRGADLFAISPLGIVVRIGISRPAVAPHLHSGIWARVARQLKVSKRMVYQIATGEDVSCDREFVNKTRQALAAQVEIANHPQSRNPKRRRS